MERLIRETYVSGDFYREGNPPANLLEKKNVMVLVEAGYVNPEPGTWKILVGGWWIDDCQH